MSPGLWSGGGGGSLGHFISARVNIKSLYLMNSTNLNLTILCMLQVFLQGDITFSKLSKLSFCSGMNEGYYNMLYM